MISKEEAIAIVEDSLKTHAKWIDYYNQGGEIDEVAGDLSHHVQVVQGYQKVIEYLRASP